MTKAQRPRVYVDTNFFIAAYEKDDAVGAKPIQLFDVFRSYPKTAVTSEMTLAELTIRVGSPREFYHGLLVANTFIDLKPVTLPILLDLGSLNDDIGRAIKLPDAIHAVTAVHSNCDHVLTADNRFPVRSPMTRVDLDPDGLASLLKRLDA